MMELRDWLIVLGVLVLVGVAADAVRRIHGRNRLRLKIDKKFKDLPDYSNDDVGEVRVVRRDGGVSEPREPSFKDADLISDVTSTETRREPALREAPRRRDDDYDLLLDDQFQGVGEGAGDYLGKPRVVQKPEPETAVVSGAGAELDDAMVPVVPEPVAVKVAPPLTDTPEPIAASVTTDDEAGVSPRPQEARRVEMEDLPVLDELTDHAPEPENDAFGAALQSVPMIDAIAPESGLEAKRELQSDLEPDLEPEQSAAATTEIEAVSEVAPTPEPVAVAPKPEGVAEALTTAPDTPALAVVEAAETLDLTRPVPEILAEQARKTASEARADAGFASDAENTTDLVIAETDSPTQTAESGDSSQLGGADSRNELSADEVADAFSPAAEAAGDDDLSTRDGGVKPAQGEKRRREPRPEVQTTFFEHFPDLAPEPSASATRKSGATRTSKPSKPKEPQPAPDEVLVITVMARQTPFSGRALFKLVEACGLTFGRMSIFHRHEQDNGEGPVQFSMVNAVHPGTFQPDEAADFSTPGVTFFLTMSEPSKLMEAFDCMLATAQCVADNLSGELRDEHRSSLRSQTVEHYRQKIRDFERRRLARRA